MNALLDPVLLTQQLQERLPQFASVVWAEQLDSTNSELLREARKADCHYPRPALLGAVFQTSGRGRNGKKWHNLKGTTLTFSCAFDVEVPASHLGALAPVSGVVLCEQLRSLLPPEKAERVQLKWPNDILFEGAKLSGLLVEVVRPPQNLRRSEDHHVVVVGMGMNMSHAEQLTQALSRPVADWFGVVGQSPIYSAKREHIVQMIAKIVTAWGQAYDHYTDFTPYQASFAQINALHEAQVNVAQDGLLVLRGQVQGVDALGQLQVRDSEGKVHTVRVGEVSIIPNF